MQLTASAYNAQPLISSKHLREMLFWRIVCTHSHSQDKALVAVVRCFITEKVFSANVTDAFEISLVCHNAQCTGNRWMEACTPVQRTMCWRIIHLCATLKWKWIVVLRTKSNGKWMPSKNTTHTTVNGGWLHCVFEYVPPYDVQHSPLV